MPSLAWNPLPVTLHEISGLGVRSKFSGSQCATNNDAEGLLRPNPKGLARLTRIFHEG
uniref:Uncharacterized protein n=1 Tax=Magnetococcus massalia (strain MO-1) TaxID=451514 RepID=A0A1S7LJW5_MAGMO|nr:protein of unknown function [Candidatus Magnetococcus massalia]